VPDSPFNQFLALFMQADLQNVAKPTCRQFPQIGTVGN